MAALGAAGSVGGAAGIAKAVNDAKAGKRALKESERHNKTMEAIAIGKGLYLKAYRKGLGLYLKPYPKKSGKVTSTRPHRLGSDSFCQTYEDTPFSRRLYEGCPTPQGALET